MEGDDDDYEAGRNGWRTAGQVIALLLCVGGLTLIGFIAFVIISFNSWGSNK